MPEDGRTARGAASRTALIEAALRVLERSGPQGVTHRAVAREANLSSPQAVRYHFGTIDELFVSAIQAATVSWPELNSAAGTDSPARDLATVLVNEARHNRQRLIAEVELYLLASRRPALRAATDAWAAAISDQFGELDHATRCSVKAAIDGICLQLLVSDEAMSIDLATEIIERSLRAATTPGTGRRLNPGLQ